MVSTNTLNTAKDYTGRVTDRGNKDMKVLTIYLLPQQLRDFKARCAIEGKSMTGVIQEMIAEFLKKK